jgi:predicted lipid-binding transport protein (Tim44 family)
MGFSMLRLVSTGQFMRLCAAVLTVFAFTAPIAEARPGGGFSTGSRGLKTYTPPPSTKTAPGATQGVQRSATPAPQAAKPTVGAAQTAAPSRFGGGFMGGLLGAGLLGGLLGLGFFGGLGSLMGVLGFVLQLALIGGLVYLGLAWWRGRNQPAAAGGRDLYQRTAMNEEPRAGTAAGAMGVNAGAPSGATKQLTIEPADYDSFERLLSVIQLSFGRADTAALRSATTGEMLGYFTEQLDENAKKGLRNDVADPKLLSGDLAEAWSEASGDYATVAMRYTLLDVTVEDATGKVVSGSKTQPQEITEVWTFTRRLGGGPNAWRLSAIQQVS